MLQTILLLLTIAGALPEAIEGFKALWDWIDSIRDDDERDALQREVCDAICAQVCPVAKKVVSQAKCLETIQGLTERAKSISQNQQR